MITDVSDRTVISNFVLFFDTYWSLKAFFGHTPNIFVSLLDIGVKTAKLMRKSIYKLFAGNPDNYGPFQFILPRFWHIFSIFFLFFRPQIEIR